MPRTLNPRRNIDPVVYFVKSGDFVKIGFTVDIKKRLVNLQNGNPQKLELLAIIRPGSERLERKLHYKYRLHQHNNEWFRYCTRLREYIELLIKAEKIE